MIAMRFAWPVIWFALGVLLAWHWVTSRRRLREAISSPPPEVDDDAIQRIEDEGVLSTNEDEPLDLENIAEEEDDFWGSESWDPAEEP